MEPQEITVTLADGTRLSQPILPPLPFGDPPDVILTLADMKLFMGRRLWRTATDQAIPVQDRKDFVAGAFGQHLMFGGRAHDVVITEREFSVQITTATGHQLGLGFNW